jgi:hypothetical protein
VDAVDVGNARDAEECGDEDDADGSVERAERGRDEKRRGIDVHGGGKRHELRRELGTRWPLWASDALARADGGSVPARERRKDRSAREGQGRGEGHSSCTRKECRAVMLRGVHGYAQTRGTGPAITTRTKAEKKGAGGHKKRVAKGKPPRVLLLLPLLVSSRAPARKEGSIPGSVRTAFPLVTNYGRVTHAQGRAKVWCAMRI